MNAQLEQQIQADFPFMKLNKIDGEENLYRRWGCDCDDGWYNLIHDMCQAIADRYAEEGLPIDLIPTQLTAQRKICNTSILLLVRGSPIWKCSH